MYLVIYFLVFSIAFGISIICFPFFFYNSGNTPPLSDQVIEVIMMKSVPALNSDCSMLYRNGTV